MQVVLVMLRRDGEARSFSISKDVTILGRGLECDLRIALPEISRRHARLVKSDVEVVLEDLGSANGTKVNGQLVTRRALEAGDKIEFVSVTFVVQIDGEPAGEDGRITGREVGHDVAGIERQISDTDV